MKHGTGSIKRERNADASADALREALVALPSIGGALAVTRLRGVDRTVGYFGVREGQMEEEASGSSEAYVDTEYGRGYSVTFHDVTNPGDLALLEPIEDLLTGAGAAVLVQETTKGAEASGSEAAVHFSAARHCSATPTRPGICGAPVDAYEIEWGLAAASSSASLFATAAAAAAEQPGSDVEGASTAIGSIVLDDDELLYRVQKVTLEGDLLASSDVAFSHRHHSR